jgi:hypothetical protein
MTTIRHDHSNTTAINNNNNNNNSSIYDGHAVSRSNELVSCAKTAWKIIYHQQQQQLQPHQSQQDPATTTTTTTTNTIPPTFRLASLSDPAPPSLVMLEDGLTLLRSMEYGLQQLQLLVRRRGHTNDPTQEIATLTQQLQQDTTELTEFCSSLLLLQQQQQQQQQPTRRRRRTISSQERKHWGYVVQWFQQVAAHFAEQLQECLKLRGEILTEQAQQRRKLTSATITNTNTNTSTKKSTIGNGALASKTATTTATRKTSVHNLRGVSSATTTTLYDSPLFQEPSSSSSKKLLSSSSSSGPNWSYNSGSALSGPNHSSSHVNGVSKETGTTSTASSTTYYNNNGLYEGYFGGGGGGGGGGYGGGYGGSGQSNYYHHHHNNNNNNNSHNSMGMRQRRGNISSSTIPAPAQQQQEQQIVEEEQKVHSQIQLRQNQRETQKRLEEAKQAETMLGELGRMFGKMSTLISQQGEMLEKIEDDVECALVDVQAGQEELTKLYSIKKGNRPLIIKTFAILNFLIIFMRIYYQKK